MRAAAAARPMHRELLRPPVTPALPSEVATDAAAAGLGDDTDVAGDAEVVDALRRFARRGTGGDEGADGAGLLRVVTACRLLSDAAAPAAAARAAARRWPPLAAPEESSP